MREVDSYLENLGSTMDHVHYVELQGLIPSVLQVCTPFMVLRGSVRASVMGVGG